MTYRTIHQQFRDAYRAAKSKGTLAFTLDWPAKEVGRTMNAPLVRLTPRMAERLAKLADALNYSGPHFEEADLHAGLAELRRLAAIAEREIKR